MDIAMPGMSGLEATREIMKAQPDEKVLILTMHEGPHLVDDSRRAGAKGLLTKSEAAHELTPALQAIIAGGSYFC
jgi:DNA-binding NarL/FixJ family response regulator